jgi:hypothetical protein
MRTHDVGELVYIGNHSTLLDDAGVAVEPFKVGATPTDPTTVTILVRVVATDTTTVYSWPTGSPAATRETTGRFYVTRTPAEAEAGVWEIRIVATGAVQTAEQSAFYVKAARPVTPVVAP